MNLEMIEDGSRRKSNYDPDLARRVNKLVEEEKRREVQPAKARKELLHEAPADIRSCIHRRLHLPLRPPHAAEPGRDEPLRQHTSGEEGSRDPSGSGSEAP